jgi:hypothetical protein
MANLKIVGFPRGHTSPIETKITRIHVRDDCLVLITDDNPSPSDLQNHDYITIWLNEPERDKLSKLLAQTGETTVPIYDQRTKK